MSDAALLTSRLRLEDFRFDPNAQVEHLHDLDKLRAVQDPDLRRWLWDLYWHCERNETDEGFERREAARRKREDQAEFERLNGLADRAVKGEFGFLGKQLANTMLGERGEMRTREALKQFQRELRKLPR